MAFTRMISLVLLPACSAAVEVDSCEAEGGCEEAGLVQLQRLARVGGHDEHAADTLAQVGKVVGAAAETGQFCCWWPQSIKVEECPTCSSKQPICGDGVTGDCLEKVEYCQGTGTLCGGGAPSPAPAPSPPAGPSPAPDGQCTYSSDRCSGNQCCPRASETNDKTYNCPSASADFAGCEVKPFVASPFKKYPDYNGTLAVQGKVYANGGGKKTVKVMWKLTGADSQCLEGAADSIKNGCGIHIHKGKTCETASEVGGHYYDEASGMSDPWLPVKYVATGSQNSEGSASVEIGVGWLTAEGRAMVVHDFQGGRIACALLKFA